MMLPAEHNFKFVGTSVNTRQWAQPVTTGYAQ